MRTSGLHAHADLRLGIRILCRLGVFAVLLCIVGPVHAQRGNEADTQRGKIVGSLVSGPGAERYIHKIGYRTAGGGGGLKGWITCSPLENMSVKDGGGTGVVFLKELPVGTYEFFTCYMYVRHGEIEAKAEPRAPFSIPFRVEPNRVTYLGAFHLIPGAALTPRRKKIAVGGTYEIRDKLQRDLPVLMRRYPRVDWSALDSKIVRPPAGAAPLFKR